MQIKNGNKKKQMEINADKLWKQKQSIQGLRVMPLSESSTFQSSIILDVFKISNMWLHIFLPVLEGKD